MVHNLVHKSKEPVLPSCICDRLLANSFSAYFDGKIEKIRTGFNDKCLLSYNVFDAPQPIVRLTEFKPTTCDEVLKILMKSPTNSGELDPLPTWVIKEYVHEIIPVYNTHH